MSTTPGPWSACHDGKCQCKTVMGKDYPVAEITAGNWGDDYPSIRLVGDSSLELKAEAYMEQITYGTVSEETAIANALLIAAAPELLEACKALMEDMVFMRHDWNEAFVPNGKMEHDMEDAGAAIWKAEGE